MFSVIDEFLISVFQYCVRQIELYTSLVRNKIIYLLLLWAFALLFLRALVSVGMFQEGSPILGVWGIVGLPLSLFMFAVIILESTEAPTDSGLPSFVYENKKERFFALLATVTLFLIAWGGFDLSECFGEDLIGTFVFLLFVEMVISTAVEYLLCTTSLPPGEKERKQQEREMKDASSAPA